MSPIRLGIVGLGLIWLREHRQLVAALPDSFTPVAFCDISEERRQATAQEFPGAPIFADYQELINLPEVDAVLVLTPIAYNAPVALAALRAGKDVIMEKPIARSVAEGAALIAAARQAGRRLFVAEQMAYRNVEDALIALLDAGEIGELVMWERIQHVDADPMQGPLRYETTPWRKQPDYPLGALFDGGIHVIAGLSKVFGPPESVFAAGRRLRPEYGDYDHVLMTFQYANGASGVFSHATALPPTQNRYVVYGTKATIVAESTRLLVEQSPTLTRTVELPAENMRVNLWRAFATAYANNEEPYYTAEKALQDVAILVTVDQAIKSGQRLPVVGS